MTEKQQGKLYERMSEIDRQFNDKMADLSFEDLKPVLDEAKADYPTEETVKQECKDLLQRLQDNEESQQIVIRFILSNMRAAWFEKWHGKP